MRRCNIEVFTGWIRHVDRRGYDLSYTIGVDMALVNFGQTFDRIYVERASLELLIGVL